MTSPQHSSSSANTTPIVYNNVLIVDDDPNIGMLTSFFLNKLGVLKSEHCESVNEAVTLIQENNYDLVLTDLDIPQRDGFELIEHCVNQHPHTNMILMSGHSSTLLRSVQHILSDMPIEILGILDKPFTQDDLKQVLFSNTPVHSNHQPLPEDDDLTIDDVLQNLILHLQPKLDAKTGKVIGAEALARVQHPEKGLLPPARFLHLLQTPEDHLRFALSTVNQAMDLMYREGEALKGVKVAINLTLSSLRHPHFYSSVMALLQTNEAAPSQILFEVTEDEIFARDIQLVKTLGRLVLEGFSFSLDDFGTGFSNLERLRLLPISEVKLDRSFVQGMLHDDFAREVTSSFIALANSLSLSTVIEGVETEEERDYLLSLGAQIFQGFLFSKPLPEAEFLEFTASQNHT